MPRKAEVEEWLSRVAATRLSPSLTIVPNPAPRPQTNGSNEHDFVRWMDCPLYPYCIDAGSALNWRGFSCASCDVCFCLGPGPGWNGRGAKIRRVRGQNGDQS